MIYSETWEERKIEPDLPAIDDFLIEDTKFIANAVTVGSQTQWSHGVQEAGWKIKAEHEKKNGTSSCVKNALFKSVNRDRNSVEFIKHEEWK